jgi:hypothetical protein
LYIIQVCPRCNQHIEYVPRKPIKVQLHGQFVQVKREALVYDYGTVAIHDCPKLMVPFSFTDYELEGIARDAGYDPEQAAESRASVHRKKPVHQRLPNGYSKMTGGRRNKTMPLRQLGIIMDEE